MRKFILAALMQLCVTTVSAQSYLASYKFDLSYTFGIK